jgi:hypothetical protein
MTARFEHKPILSHPTKITWLLIVDGKAHEGFTLKYKSRGAARQALANARLISRTDNRSSKTLDILMIEHDRENKA